MPNTFKAAVLFELNTPLEIVDIYHQEPGEGEVKIKMITSGLCGAQVNEISGKKGEDKYLPHFMGHEGYGEVVEVGKLVKTVKPKDYVILHWRQGEGANSVGVKHKSVNGLDIGAGPVTTFAEYTIISENRCTKINANSELSEALPLLGCAISTAYGAITKEAKVKSEDKVLIFGAGGLGMALIFWLKILGVKNVTVVDIHKEKEKQISKYGSSFLLSDDFKSKQSNYDVVFETTGVNSNIERTLELSNKGGRIILIGQPKIGTQVTFKNFLHLYDEISIISSAGGRFDPSIDMESIYQECVKNKELFKELVSNTISLQEVNEGFDLMRLPNAKRIIIKFDNDK